jgi:hypothetical protein
MSTKGPASNPSVAPTEHANHDYVAPPGDAAKANDRRGKR